MASLSLPISYNSLSINTVTQAAGGVPMSGYLVDEFDPWNLEVAAYMEKRALQDGADASDVYYGRRTVSAIITAYGSTHGDFWDKTQDLLAAFSPTLAYNADSANLGFLPFDFYQPTADIATWPVSAYPNGIPLRYYLRPTGVGASPIRRDDTGGVSGAGLSKQFRVGLVARSPMKVAITATSTTASPVNLGDYPAIPTIVISSNAFTGNATITINGSTLSVNIDATSTTYTVDCGARLFYKGATVRMDLLYTNSVFPTLSPGSNSKSGSGLTGGQSTVVFRHTFA